jgi:hypothetical protein
MLPNTAWTSQASCNNFTRRCNNFTRYCMNFTRRCKIERDTARVDVNTAWTWGNTAWTLVKYCIIVHECAWLCTIERGPLFSSCSALWSWCTRLVKLLHYLVKLVHNPVKLLHYLVKLVHNPVKLLHYLVKFEFKGNPTVLWAKHVPPACEHLLLILDVLLWACSRMVPEVAQALKQRGISPPSRSSIAGSCHRWTDGLLAGSAYIGQIVHEYAQGWVHRCSYRWSSWSALA